MRAVEQDALLEQLHGFPAQPWLWLAPSAAWQPLRVPLGRGICLQRAADGCQWQGDVRCALPLPLPSEAVNAIVLEHAAALQLEPLLAECARVLMPGGRLWLTLLNPCSPYRSQWQWQGARPPSATHCRAVLRRHGLRTRSVRHFGPLWSDSGQANGSVLPALRAASMLEFEKRAHAFIGPEPVRANAWRGPVAT